MGWRDEGGGLEGREREMHFREGCIFGGFENRMHPLLISKRERRLKLKCLAVLAANMTRKLHNEI